MGLYWNDEFCTGNDEIDGQHRELFSRFEGLSQACQDGHGNEIVADLLGYLEEYVEHHFLSEERLMRQYQYPGLPEQQQLHQEFRKIVAQFREKFTEEGATRNLAIAIDGTLVRWMIQHIRHIDQSMVEFLKPLLGPRTDSGRVPA